MTEQLNCTAAPRGGLMGGRGWGAARPHLKGTRSDLGDGWACGSRSEPQASVVPSFQILLTTLILWMKEILMAASLKIHCFTNSPNWPCLLNYIQIITIIIWLCHMACGVFVPGTEPRPSVVKSWSPNHWTARVFLTYMLLLCCLRKFPNCVTF